MGRGINETTLPPMDEENRNKRGNPGSRWKLTQSGVKKLESLGFDPMEKLVEFYFDITEEIEKLRTQPRFSHTAYAALRASQRQAIEVLMQYGYAKRKPDEKDPDAMPEFKIILEASKNDFKTDGEKSKS
jgi:hypothetical protein